MVFKKKTFKRKPKAPARVAPAFTGGGYSGETQDNHLIWLRHLAKLEAEKQEKARLREQLKALRKEKFRRYVLGRLGDERDG